MSTQDKIEIQEKHDLDVCLQLFNNLFEKINWEIPTNNRADVYITATTRSNKIGIYAVEIKQRNCRLLDFEDTIIQADKYEYLMSLTSAYTPLYFVIFNDCIAVYNLAKIGAKSLSKRLQLMNKITYQSNDKDYKAVYGLTPKMANIFIYKKENANDKQIAQET